MRETLILPRRGAAPAGRVPGYRLKRRHVEACMKACMHISVKLANIYLSYCKHHAAHNMRKIRAALSLQGRSTQAVSRIKSLPKQRRNRAKYRTIPVVYMPSECETEARRENSTRRRDSRPILREVESFKALHCSKRHNIASGESSILKS